MKTAYISCPMTVPQEILNKVIGLVQNAGAIAVHWVRGTPYVESEYKKIISLSDAFVIILPNLAWGSQLDKMTSGSRKELMLAIQLNKPVYLAYENRNDGMGIYSTNVTAPYGSITVIEGIASTRFNFIDFVGHGTKKTQYVNEHKDQLKKEAIAQAYGGASKTLQEEYEKYWDEARQKQWEKAERTLWGENGPKFAIDVSAIKNIDIEKVMKDFNSTGILFLGESPDPTISVITLQDSRLNLFF